MTKDIITFHAVDLAQICKTSINAFKKLAAEWNKEQTYLISAKEYALLLALQKNEPTEAPPFLITTELKEENHQVQISIGTPQMSVACDSSMSADSILLQVYDTVVYQCVTILNSKELHAQHAVVIFACEYINWAHTALCHYAMNNADTITELEARLKHLEACQNECNNPPMLIDFMTHIHGAIKTAIHQLTQLQRYMLFQHAIEALSQSMLKVLDSSLQAQYYLIACPMHN